MWFNSNKLLVETFVRKHVVFGKLILGQETLRDMENVDVDGDRPVVPVKIVNCGELNESVAALHENGIISGRALCFFTSF